MKDTHITPIRHAPFKEQYTCLIFLYYLRALFEESDRAIFTREDILMLLQLCKEDDDVFDQRVVAVLDAAETAAGRGFIERGDNNNNNKSI